MTTLSRNLKRMIKARELTQGYLAIKCHVHKNTIVRWTTGKTEPSATDLHRLSKVLHVSMEYLMEDHKNDYDN